MLMSTLNAYVKIIYHKTLKYFLFISYFDYKIDLLPMCGIPSVTLEGENSD